MNHFINTGEYSREALERIIDHAIAHKGERNQTLAGKSVALVFFDSSLRTRTSFSVGVAQLGGNSMSLEVGKGTWNLEFAEGAVMDADKPEHVKDAARVLSRYFDAICIRCFPSMRNAEEDFDDPLIECFRRYATVPIINMESSLYHPCQAMADMMTIKQRFGKTDGLKVALAWAPHIKALPTAVPNSFAVAARQFGCDLTIVAPPEYPLPEKVMRQLGNVRISHDQSLLKSQDVVYAKSWGSLLDYGVPPATKYRDWMITLDKIGQARFLHCMPLRRNIEIADDVMDSDQNDCYDEAENRLHVQKSILLNCFE
jgi:N-acetylornithine carbamoyltransferase